MTSAFYPRGGSAQVVRYLARALSQLGHAVQIVSGSLKQADPASDAAQFFDGLPLIEVDFTEAARGFMAGLNPQSAQFSVPFQPSYEDKPGVPDRVFYRLSVEEMEHLVANWRDVIGNAVREFQPNVAHMHHLNHVHLAALATPGVDRLATVAQLHGTELMMLDEMQHLSDDVDGRVRLWGTELRRAAGGMQHLVTISPDNAERARRILKPEEDKLSVIPNGVDAQLFTPGNWPMQRKLALLEQLLVRSPRGWDESGRVGSVRYERNRLGALFDDAGNLKPLLLFVGRFLAFKRLPLLMDAVARANDALGSDASYNLLVCGGVPGEWEGEHPHTVAGRLGLKNVFFCGWLPHEELADVYNLADAFVAPSSNEPFGQVFLEAMATSVPVIATRSGGPASFVVGEGQEASGWLAAVDDVESLARVVIEAISNNPERKRRGRNARDLVTAGYTWPRIAGEFEQLYRRLLSSNLSSR